MADKINFDKEIYGGFRSDSIIEINKGLFASH